jgi:hypothetical protein
MALATCRRCQAVFIVDTERQGETAGPCPYCGQALEPVSPEEVQRRIEKRRRPSGPRDTQGRPRAQAGFGISGWIAAPSWPNVQTPGRRA